MSQEHSEPIVVPGEELPGGLEAALALPDLSDRLQRLADDMLAADRAERVSHEELRNICLR